MLNINAATERQLKDHLKVGVRKAHSLITKRNQQPGKCFTYESFISEIGRMEGASEWVQRGLISFGSPHTPKSKRHRGASRKLRKTSTPISEKPERTSSMQMSLPLTSPEGDGHGEGGTGRPIAGVMDPSIIEQGMPQGPVPVPMTLMYTPYQQPPVSPRFGSGGHQGLFNPRGDGLGASPINPSGSPRFPIYNVGNAPSVQQTPIGFNPRAPGGLPMGFPRGPPPRFPPKYSQVITMRGKQIYSPPSANGIYGNRDGSASDTGRSPDTSPKVTPDKGIVVPGGLEGIPAQIPDDQVIPDRDLTTEGSGMGPTNIQDPINPDDPNNQGPVNLDDPDNQDPINPDEPDSPDPINPDEPDNQDPINPAEPSNGGPTNQEEPNNGGPTNQEEPNNGTPINPNEPNTGDPKAEIEALRQAVSSSSGGFSQVH